MELEVRAGSLGTVVVLVFTPLAKELWTRIELGYLVSMLTSGDISAIQYKDIMSTLLFIYESCSPSWSE